jgi:flagellar biosynthesis chaperone FliJ
MATQTKTQTEKDTNQVTKRILEAYEQNLQTVADYQDKVADQTKVDWIAGIARAQANFTREISRILK